MVLWERSIIRIGVIGYGFMGKTHVQNIQRIPQAKLVAIYTLPDVKVELQNVDVITDDWKKVVDNPNVDAIVIATPTPSHAEIAIYAANKKKHVFVEKPMARTVNDCTKMIEAAQKNQITLFVAHVLRFWPSYITTNQAIQSKENSIGNLKMIKASRFSAFPGWAEWFKNETLSGGCILDLSIHDLDYAAWIINKPIKSVYCEGRKIPELGIDNWGVSMTTLQFSDGEIAHCEAAWTATTSYGFATQCEIIGDEGIIRFDSRNPIPIKIYGKDGVQNDDPLTEDGYYLEMVSFIASIVHKTPPAVSGEAGRLAVAICIAAIQSAKTQKSIAFTGFIEAASKGGY